MKEMMTTMMMKILTIVLKRKFYTENSRKENGFILSLLNINTDNNSTYTGTSSV